MTAFFRCQNILCDRLGVDCLLTNPVGGVNNLDIQTELFEYPDHPGAGFPNKDLSHVACLHREKKIFTLKVCFSNYKIMMLFVLKLYFLIISDISL